MVDGDGDGEGGGSDAMGWLMRVCVSAGTMMGWTLEDPS
jgi:hypothetical protein